MTNHLFDAVRRASTPDAVFLEQPDGRIWTYGKAFAFSGRLAGAIQDAGVVPGDRVAVQVEKSADALMLYLACLRVGAVYLPLNTGYTLAELEHFVADAQPRLVVCSPHRRDGVEGLAARHGAKVESLSRDGTGSLVEAARRFDEAFRTVPREADDLAAILYTSGTTGRSKGAMLSHDNLLSNALALRQSWRVTAADRLIHALPIFHTHGLFVATNVVMLAGASMFLLDAFDAERVLSLMPRSTVMMGVPTFYTRLLRSPNLTRDAAASMRLFVSGSAPLLAATHEEFRARTGHAILERYGMTETNMNTSNPYEGERVAGTVGLPLPGVAVRIAGGEGDGPADADRIGMIEVKGPNVFRGYWRMPEKTAEEFTADGFFVTGDLGRLDERGYLQIVGRGKDLVISGGYNIYPKEVEAAIDEIDGVVESAVIGVPHPDFGEGLTAVVVRRRDAALDEAAVLASLRDRLARYKQPKQVVFVDELPRNAMGKVQKKDLRDLYQNLFSEV